MDYKNGRKVCSRVRLRLRKQRSTVTRSLLFETCYRYRKLRFSGGRYLKTVKTAADFRAITKVKKEQVFRDSILPKSPDIEDMIKNVNV